MLDRSRKLCVCLSALVINCGSLVACTNEQSPATDDRDQTGDLSSEHAMPDKKKRLTIDEQVSIAGRISRNVGIHQDQLTMD